MSVCAVMGTKVNTTAYHSQTDGLVERFNHTLINMRVTKTQEWDDLLLYALFAYRSTLQVSTGDSPFRLLYGRDPQLPSELVLDPPVHRETVQLDDYKTVMAQQMELMWEVARQNTVKVQKQKLYHDKEARATSFHVGDRVFVHMPALKTGPAHKLARPFKGPYQVLTTYSNGAEVVPVDRSRAAPICVTFNQLRQCPEEIPEPSEEQSVLEQVVEPGPTDNAQEDETSGSGAEGEELEV